MSTKYALYGQEKPSWLFLKLILYECAYICMHMYVDVCIDMSIYVYVYIDI